MLITLFYTVLVVGVLAVVTLGVLGYSNKSGDDFKAKYRREARKRIVAEKALRQIAGGSTGSPVLEAQLALDSIESINIKEIV